MKKLFLMIFGLMVSNISIANPTYDVTNGALQNDPALCSYGYNPNCSSGNTAPPPKKIIYHDVFVPPKFGAFAYSQKAGHLAGAVNQNSLAAAKREAINLCIQGSGDKNCKVVQWSRNGCVAAAEGKLGNKFHLVTGAGKVGEAEQEVLTGCRNNGAKNCKIIMPEGCSLPQ